MALTAASLGPVLKEVVFLEDKFLDFHQWVKINGKDQVLCPNLLSLGVITTMMESNLGRIGFLSSYSYSPS